MTRLVHYLLLGAVGFPVVIVLARIVVQAVATMPDPVRSLAAAAILGAFSGVVTWVLTQEFR